MGVNNLVNISAEYFTPDIRLNSVKSHGFMDLKVKS